jgi:hypothetical protein
MKMLSQKQLDANRRNAAKSTGPKTPAGRAASAANATKHGLYSPHILVSGRTFQEDPAEFDALRRRFAIALKPVGPIEEMLVDQIVTAHWRLCRAQMAEAGEIALSMDSGQWQRSRKLHPDTQWFIWANKRDPVPNMEDSADGNAIILSCLRRVRDALLRDGRLTQDAIAILDHCLSSTNSLSEKLRSMLDDQRPGTDPDKAGEIGRAHV